MSEDRAGAVGSGTSAPVPSQPARPPIAAAAALLDGLHDQPLDAHPDVYERLHQTLQVALADINDA